MLLICEPDDVGEIARGAREGGGAQVTRLPFRDSRFVSAQDVRQNQGFEEGIKRSIRTYEATPVAGVILTDDSGRARLRFQAPNNTGTFNLRGYAADDSKMQFGSSEVDMLVHPTSSDVLWLWSSKPRHQAIEISAACECYLQILHSVGL